MSNANFVRLLRDNNLRLIIINTFGSQNIPIGSFSEAIEVILNMNVTQSLPISNNIKNIIKCFLTKKRINSKKCPKNKRTKTSSYFKYLYILKYYFNIIQSKFSKNKYLIFNLFCKSILFNIINKFLELIKSIIQKLNYFYSFFKKNNTSNAIILYDANFYPLIEQQEKVLNVEHPIIKEIEKFCAQKYEKNKANKIEFKKYYSEKESNKRIGLKKLSEF